MVEEYHSNENRLQSQLSAYHDVYRSITRPSISLVGMKELNQEDKIKILNDAYSCINNFYHFVHDTFDVRNNK
jgi:hypothetical protein